MIAAGFALTLDDDGTHRSADYLSQHNTSSCPIGARFR
jgi:hypothetical protein